MPATQAFSNVHCPKCGYLLKGLNSDVCPECGIECTPALLNHAQRRANRMRWMLALFLVALIMYAPHGWLLFIDHRWDNQRWLWIKLWPILPGLPAVMLTRSFWRLPDWAEFAAMGVFTVAILLLLTWIASRGRVALILVVIILAPLAVWFGVVTHALFML